MQMCNKLSKTLKTEVYDYGPLWLAKRCCFGQITVSERPTIIKGCQVL